MKTNKRVSGKHPHITITRRVKNNAPFGHVISQSVRHTLEDTTRKRIYEDEQGEIIAFLLATIIECKGECGGYNLVYYPNGFTDTKYFDNFDDALDFFAEYSASQPEKHYPLGRFQKS